MKRFLILFLLLPTVAWGGDAYFISKNGSNSNTGTSWAQAWLTAGKADSTLSTHGDTIVFGAGTWTNVMLRVPSGGSPTSWQIYCCSSYYEYLIGNITYAQAVSGRLSAGAYKTQITSGQPLTSWTYLQSNSGDSVWYASFTEDHTIGWSNRTPYAFSEGWASNRVDSQFNDKADYNADSSTTVSGITKGNYWAKGSTGSTIFMSPFQGGNPNSNGHTYWASGVPTVVFGYRGSGITKYTKIWGIEMKMGMQGVIMWQDNLGRGDCSTFVEYCHIAMGGQQRGENAAAVMARCNQGTSDSMNFHRWVFLTNDSIGWSRGVGGDHDHPSCVVVYSGWYWKIDSCVIYGGGSNIGVNFKNDDYVTQTTHTYKGNVVRNSYIFNVSRGVMIMEIPWRDSVYGNVIEANRSTVYGNWGVILEPAHGSHPDALWKYDIYVANNTFFNCRGPAFDFLGGGNTNRVGESTKFVYNIVANWVPTVSNHNSPLCNYYNAYYSDYPADGKGVSQIDYNMYWNDSPYVAFRAGWGNATGSGNLPTVNWGTWNSTWGYDTNGDTSTNPGFNDPNNTSLNWRVRFSRPSVSSEMSADYGGRVWTVFGAVQDSAPASQFCPGYSMNGPSNGGTVTDLPVNLTFDLSDGDDDSVLYRLFLDTASICTTQVKSDTLDPPQSNVTYSATGLSNNETYYWRLILADTCDGRAEAVCVETTGVYSFTTDTTTSQTSVRRGILIKPGGPE